MPVATTPQAEFVIPTVDISPYLKNHDASTSEAQKIIEDIRKACTTSGFFQLTGHGVPCELQEQMFQAAKLFFDLPFEEKMKLDRRVAGGISNRGYEVIGNQSLQDGTMTDLKEGFYIGQNVPADDPRSKAHPVLIGPNIWPSPELVPDHLFKEPTTLYREKTLQLGFAVMDLIAKSLPYGDEVFGQCATEDPVATIRMLHYPPQKTTDVKQLGAGAHTDFGMITLLLQDSQSGLQVYNPAADQWVDVPPVKEAYVVNVGDMLSMLTSGHYKSALHRVINHSGTHRYSCPLFLDGDVNFKLAALDGSTKPEDVITCEQHMISRFNETYGRVAKAAA